MAWQAILLFTQFKEVPKMAKRRQKQTEMEIRWKTGSRFSEAQVPVEKAYAEICTVKKQNGGKVTAGDLVTFATGHPKSAIHKLIGQHDGWDDAKAAHRYRVMRAGNVLRSIEVKYSEEQREPVRCFSPDTSAWSKAESRYKPYRPTEDILKDEGSRADLLQRALNELLAFQRKYRALNELALLVREIDSFVNSYHAAK